MLQVSPTDHRGPRGYNVRVLGHKTIEKSEINRVLVRATNWVGDAVMNMPALEAVRENFPESTIVVLARPWVIPLLENHPAVDQVLPLDKGKGYPADLVEILRVAGRIRKLRFDLAILFQNAFEAAIFTYLAGVPNRLGYDTDNRRFLLTHSIKMRPRLKEIHEIDYYLGVLQAVGLKLDGRDLSLAVTDQERNRAREILKKQHITTRDKLVGVSPGATYGSAKRWFPERYAALCDKIHESHGVRIIIFGGPGEEGTGCRVSESMRHPSVNLCGKTTLRETAALIERWLPCLSRFPAQDCPPDSVK